MSPTVSPLAALGLCTIAIVASGTGPASAASPAYCALYAREYANQFEDPAAIAAAQRLQDQAYYRCLNLDEDPEFPVTSAYFGAEFDDSVAAETGSPVISEGDTSEDEIVEPADDPPVVAKPRRTASSGTSRRRGRGSGLEPWTPEWVAWCTEHYRSFDPETGYVKPYTGKRKLCP